MGKKQKQSLSEGIVKIAVIAVVSAIGITALIGLIMRFYGYLTKH